MRSIAYAADDTPVRPQSMQPFPATGAKYQLFVKGINDTPHKPVWSHDGKELFYVPRFGGFEVIKVTTRPEFSFGPASPVARPFQPGPPNARTLFDVAPDGRFLAMFDPNELGPLHPPREIAVVLDWFEEVRAKVPVP
jgi:hypothetical protein